MNKNERIVMGATLMALLIVFAGITYAFFSANTGGISASTITATGGLMKISYSDGTEELGGKLTSENFQPSNEILVDKTFTITGKNTATGNGEEGLNMNFTVGLKYESTFTDGQLHWYFKRVSSVGDVNVSMNGTGASIPGDTNGSGYRHGTFNPDENDVILATGNFPAATTDQSVTFNLKLQFPDTGENQDENKGATFNGRIYISNETIYNVSKLKDYITLLGEDTENGLEYDDYDNLRYVGSNPNNYIKFNDETWRIIGIVDGGVKIIRQDRITDVDGNNTMKWNTAGTNDWTTASLQTYLNGTYYESLTSTAKEQIEERTWDIGGIAYNSSGYEIKETYNQERGTTVYSGRPTEWEGKIGLMYPSDWGYASTNTSCRTALNGGSCSYSNWLYSSRVESGNDTSQYAEWTLSPLSSNSYYAFYVSSSGGVSYYYVDIYSWGARPVVYLKSNISKVQGDGSAGSPFVIA